MVTIQSGSYTSLTYLLPSASTCQQRIIRVGMRFPSRIRPLVKHAVSAYLQPVGSPPAAGEKGLFWRLRERRC
ncbi:hypothetical protein V6N13_149618 [Hibiscus sabdariffa]|uniref:Uncharacterized protein n=1 Tax=Hibiscus sabdariffa TaxID=183260 RepID=A0ABR2EID2_9ROSI